ncbi:hypothetical protein [Phenylobacterium sp.]|jgi:hypothetical protein|uniref:hypothetical protein n=1 Tax=Phenylobacterium sp. TaxID=1871053 RepID=UPI002F92C781
MWPHRGGCAAASPADPEPTLTHRLNTNDRAVHPARVSLPHSQRLVFDVAGAEGAVILLEDGRPHQRHARVDAAVQAARELAAAAWMAGLRASVRRVHEDGAITPLYAYG